MAPPQSVDFRKPAEGRYSEAVILGPGKVVFTGTQLAFGERRRTCDWRSAVWKRR